MCPEFCSMDLMDSLKERAINNKNNQSEGSAGKKATIPCGAHGKRKDEETRTTQNMYTNVLISPSISII